MPTFLVKTEPSEYAFEDLLRETRTAWTGVSNPAANGHLRAMAKGDEVFVYHTGDVKSVVGLARVTKAAYPDPARPALAADGTPKFAVVELEAVRAVPRVITLAAIKADPQFADFLLVRIGRLSVMPVPPAIDKLLRTMAGL